MEILNKKFRHFWKGYELKKYSLFFSLSFCKHNENKIKCHQNKEMQSMAPNLVSSVILKCKRFFLFNVLFFFCTRSTLSNGSERSRSNSFWPEFKCRFSLSHLECFSLVERIGSFSIRNIPDYMIQSIDLLVLIFEVTSTIVKHYIE